MLHTSSLNIKCTYRKDGGWPNTYTFSKALAEEIIQKTNRRFPVAIVRPSMGKTDIMHFSITHRYLPNFLKHTTCINFFQNKIFLSILLTQNIYIFHILLTVNINYFPKHH